MAISAAVVALASCAPGNTSRESAPDAPMTIEQVLAAHTDEWMRLDGVEGTSLGLCDDTPCIKIFVSLPPERFDSVLPDTVDGYLVYLEPTGGFEPR